MKKVFAISRSVAAGVALVAVALAVGAPRSALAQAGDIAKSPYIGAIVVDARTGEVLREDGANRPGYPASMLKLMDMFVTFDALDAGEVSLQDQIRVSERAMKMGGSQVYLDVRETVTLENLLYAVMVQSANDAALLLAEHVGGSAEAFVDRMNAKARELGLSPITRFVSPHGLPPDSGRPDMTTPADFAKLCVALVREHPEILDYTSVSYRQFHSMPERATLFDMRTHNPLLGSFDGCDGLKTGYFKKAGYSIAATVKRGDARVIAVVMGSKTKEDRNAAIKDFLNYGLSRASHGAMPAPTRKPAAAASAEPPPAPTVAAPEATALPDAEVAPDATDATEPAPAPAPEQKASRGWWKSILWIGSGALVIWIALLILKRRLLVTR